MEPEDLLGVGADGAPAGADELRSIVARAGRRRLRAAAGGLTAALLVGGGAGYALSNHSSPGQTVATAPAASSTGGSQSSPGQSSVASGSPNVAYGTSVSGVGGFSTQRLTLLFTRTTGSIDIRGFEVNPSYALPEGAALPVCGVLGPRFQAEVSTSKMVGTAVSAFSAPDPAKALSEVDTAMIGVAEGDPVLVVTAATGTGVAQVRETGFTGGATDSMAPVHGWIALAGPTSAPSSSSLKSPLKVGTVTALSASGKVLASESVTWPFPPVAAPQMPLGAPSSSIGSAQGASSFGCEGGGTISGKGVTVCASSRGTISLVPATTSGTEIKLAPAVSSSTSRICPTPLLCDSTQKSAGGVVCPSPLCPTSSIVTSPGSASGSASGASTGAASGGAQVVCTTPLKAASTKAAG